MKTMEIYFSDLNEIAREEFIKLFGEDGNYDIAPLFIYEQEDEEKEYCTQNNSNCQTCSLVNYGKDCRNEPI